jgi:hypothetical protein
MLVEFLRSSSKVSNLNQTVSYYFNVTVSKDVYIADDKLAVIEMRQVCPAVLLITVVFYC